MQEFDYCQKDTNAAHFLESGKSGDTSQNG